MNQNPNPNKQMIDKMGYDRSITMFSPDGRLLQVEYAKKTVKQGSTAIGIACKDGVVLVSDKRIASKLVVAEALEKMFRIDDHIAVTAAGILSDARVLVDRTQLRAQQHSVTYDSKIDILSIVKEICDLKQICTQSAGLRPFGVSLLVGGVEEDGTIKLFVTEPYGLYFQHYAAVIGEGEANIEPILQKRYKSSLSVDDGLKIGLEALKDFLGPEFNYDRVDAVVIRSSDKRYKKLTNDELKAVFK
jgi:proteasome alpha subunit